MLPLFLSRLVDMTFGEERQALSSDGDRLNGVRRLQGGKTRDLRHG
jgi:hypothetical protein